MSRDFDGTSGARINLSSIGFTRAAGEPMTILARFSPAALTSAHVIVGNRTDTPSTNLLKIQATNGGWIGFEYDSTGSGFNIAYNLPVVTGTKYTIAGRYDGDQGEMFLNGLSVATSSTGLTSAAITVDDWAIGNRDASNDGEEFDGLIEDVGVYDVALSDAEIKQWSLGLMPCSWIRPESHRGCWPLTGLETPERDVSFHQNDGTPTSGVGIGEPFGLGWVHEHTRRMLFTSFNTIAGAPGAGEGGAVYHHFRNLGVYA